MSKERTVVLRTASLSVEAGEAAVGARPATVASDEKQQSITQSEPSRRGRSSRGRRVRDPRRRAETQRLSFDSEKADDPEVPLELFTRERIDQFRGVSMLSLVQHWSLEARQRTADVNAIEELLAARYGYWTDDVDHADPFHATRLDAHS
jgi:hypothetical protein